jgi:hypothetical protein
MSRSLNSDYLDQLLIRADTSRLDTELVHDAVEGRPVPEEERALLVFKRGCAAAPHTLPPVAMRGHPQVSHAPLGGRGGIQLPGLLASVRVTHIWKGRRIQQVH